LTKLQCSPETTDTTKEEGAVINTAVEVTTAVEEIEEEVEDHLSEALKSPG
jgi:hypothetical protein